MSLGKFDALSLGDVTDLASRSRSYLGLEKGVGGWMSDIQTTPYCVVRTSSDKFQRDALNRDIIKIKELICFLLNQ